MKGRQLLFKDLLTYPREVSWKYSDKTGLSERTLDCFQLCVKEVLLRKGIDSLIPIFLGAFDCQYPSKLILRRRVPQLHMGWTVTKHFFTPNENIKLEIKSALDREGYCLFFYRAFYAQYSSYYQNHDIIHWALVIDYDDSQITLVDDTGIPSYFQGNIGQIPWDEFLYTFREYKDIGIGTVTQLDHLKDISWERSFYERVTDSVFEMTTNEGLNRLSMFIEDLNQVALEELSSYLELLEFDVHYFRKLRELWLLAATRRVIPQLYFKPEWVEELLPLCKAWSLVMGVLMKWKKQHNRDYRDKLLFYLQNVLVVETHFLEGLKKVLEVDYVG